MSLRGTEIGIAAEQAAQRVMTQMEQNNKRAGSLVVASLRSAGCDLRCVASDFGAATAAIRGVSLQHCSPPQADAPLTKAAAAALRGKLAVVQRGGVTVPVKAKRVADAGAVGLIIVNTHDKAWSPAVKTLPTKAEAEDARGTTIPVVIVPKSSEIVLQQGAAASLFVGESGEVFEPEAATPEASVPLEPGPEPEPGQPRKKQASGRRPGPGPEPHGDDV